MTVCQAERVETGLAERIEIEAYVDFAAGAGPGVATRRFGSAVALAVPADRTGFWAKAGGFDSEVTLAGLTEILDFFTACDVPTATLAIAPDRLPADWPDIVAKLGLEPHGRKAKMAADPAGVTLSPNLDPALRVAPVERGDAEQWAEVMMTTFGTPNLAPMAAAAIGRPNWRSYAVWEAAEIVAVASTLSHAGATTVFGGATVPRARNRGAQSALLATRAAVARAAGVRLLVGETEADPGNPSLRNLRRAGFTLVYERTDWLWRRPAASLRTG
jgi:GNAT superfamily N-acetyltransferase